MGIYKGRRPWFSSFIRYPHNVNMPRLGSGAPTNGSAGTGATVDGIGSIYIDYVSGSIYNNIGTKASPFWSILSAGGTDATQVGGSATKFSTTQFDAVTGTTGVTLTNVVGLTGFSLGAAATYKFTVHISGVSTANCGIKLGFGYTTLTATSIEAAGRGYTASAVATQHTTTATTGMTLFGQTAAVIDVEITGRLVVNAAGTLAVQAAQNAAHADTTSVYVGSWATFTRIS